MSTPVGVDDLDLSRGLLHELRQPLTALSGALALVEARLGDLLEEDGDWLFLRNQVSRLTHTLATFQEAAFASAVESVGFTTEQVVDDVLAELRRTRGVDGEVSRDGEGGLHVAHGSPGALGLAVHNLVINALDAIHGMAGGRIGVRIQGCGDRIELRVSDNGSGIAESIRGVLFRPGRSTKGEGAHHGLGLFISRQLVRRWGGDLRLVAGDDPYRASWSSTEFCIGLPAWHRGAPTPSPRAGVADLPTLSLTGAVLAVDDEPAMRFLYERMFEAVGLDVTTAASWTEVSAALAQRRFDLVMLDKNLPDVDGVEIVERIRAGDAHVPIIMISGYPSAEALDALMPLRIHGFLEKPFTEGELLPLVERALVGPGRARARSASCDVRTILVIDRDPRVRDEATALLAEMGFLAACFDDVDSALDACPEAGAALVGEDETVANGARDRLWARGLARDDALPIAVLVEHDGLGPKVRAVLAGAQTTIPRALLNDRAAARERVREFLERFSPPAPRGGD